MELQTLQFEVRDGVGRITLDRPKVGNALNKRMAQEFRHLAIRCDADPAVRAVLITANGRVFFGGGDLAEFGDAGDGLRAHLLEMTTDLHAAILRFSKMDAPVVAAVQGSAGGAGLSLVAACDLVVAAASAKFTLAYTRAGLNPDGSSTFFLSRVVGLRRAMDLALTNRVLTAQEAEAWGLVSRVVDDEALAEEAETLVQSLAAGPTVAFGATKRLLYGGAATTLETAVEQEALAIAATAVTETAREGIAAFREKRAPAFPR